MHYTEYLKEEWQAPLSTLKKLKILITVTDTEKVRLPSENYCALFSQFKLLEESQSEFDQFLVMVRIELMTKTDELKKIKLNMKASRIDRSCALVNLFMLSQYTTRMNKFEDFCRKSLENICRKHINGEEVDVVNDHWSCHQTPISAGQDEEKDEANVGCVREVCGSGDD